MRLSSGSMARFGLVALGTFGLLIGSATAATAGSASQPRWQARFIAPPVPSLIALFQAVACTGSADCAAGGQYAADDGHGGGMVISESAGTWSAAQPLSAPAGSAGPGAVSGLACASAGNCVAVGSFGQTSDNFTLPFAASESAGSWAAETLVQPPENHSPNPYAVLRAASCPAAGQCVAVGGYDATKQDRPRPMAANQSGAGWQRAVQITLPRNATRNPRLGGSLDSVACTGPGSCVAVGSYRTRSPVRRLPMAVFESHGRWGSAHQLRLPAGAAEGALGSISCLPGGDCVAVGGYYPAAGLERAFALTERHGRWTSAVRIGRTGTGATRPMQMYDTASVSCGTSSCVALGEGFHDQPLTVTFAGGKWSRYSVILPPAGSGSGAALYLFQVACTGSSACTAVGMLRRHKPGRGAVPAVASRP